MDNDTGDTTMNTRTYSVTIAAPKRRVFAYLADIKNLPEWATCFCQRLELIDGRHWVTTPQGKLLCEIRGHQATGTIDYLAGPSPEQMARWPARVLDLPGEQSLFQFTAVQMPGMSDEEFEAHGADVHTEFQNVLRALEPVAA
jgi:hypothetical protein